jgi:hypothetical protein
MHQEEPGKDGAIVTGNDGQSSGNDGQSIDHGGQSAGHQEPAAQASLGGIPPSFGASSPPPPEAPEALPPEPPAPEPPAPELTAPESTAPEPAAHLERDPVPGPDAGAPLPPILPELQDTSTVGWYPSQPAGPPSAGPFAAPATPARRGITGITGIGGLARAARPKSGQPPAWRNRRSTLANVLLFGLGPLVLVGVVVAAFLLVSPGKGTAASSLGFQAGPGATAPRSTTSAPAAPPSSPAPAKRHARPTPSAAVAKVPTISRVKPKAKTTPKPAHRSGGGGVTPHNLGLPNFAGYCQHIGHRTAELTADNAYGWHCTLYSSLPLSIADVCAWTYHLSASQVVGVSTNYSDPNAWQCWRINRDLGVLNVTSYCVAAHLGTSELVADDAYGWDCTSPLAPVNTTAACDTVYHVSDAVSRFAVFADPYSWQCWD